jgi:hypothetical protein
MSARPEAARTTSCTAAISVFCDGRTPFGCRLIAFSGSDLLHTEALANFAYLERRGKLAELGRPQSQQMAVGSNFVWCPHVVS